MKTILFTFAALAAFVLWLRRQTVIDLKMQKGFRNIEELMLRSSSTQEAEDCHRQLQDLQAQLDQVTREAEAYRTLLNEYKTEAEAWKDLAQRLKEKQGTEPEAEQPETLGGPDDSQYFEKEAEAYARFKAMNKTSKEQTEL